MDYQKAISNCRTMLSFLRADRGEQIKTRQINRIEEDTLKTAISAMQELEQYKQLGTLEEVRAAVEKRMEMEGERTNV